MPPVFFSLAVHGNKAFQQGIYHPGSIVFDKKSVADEMFGRNWLKVSDKIAD